MVWSARIGSACTYAIRKNEGTGRRIVCILCILLSTVLEEGSMLLPLTLFVGEALELHGADGTLEMVGGLRAAI